MADDFLAALAGITGNKKLVPPKPMGSESQAEALRRAAKKLEINDPADLGSIISFETGGTYDPHKVGGEGNKYKGLIQFGPEEQKKYYNPNDTFETQVEDGVVRYFQDRFKQAGKSTRGATLEDLYTTVIAGNPNADRDAKDSFGTSARSGTQRILKEHRPKVLQKFFGGQDTTVAQESDFLKQLGEITKGAEPQVDSTPDFLTTLSGITNGRVQPTKELDATIQGQIQSANDPNVKTRFGVLATEPEQATLFANQPNFKPFEMEGIGTLWLNTAKIFANKKLKLKNEKDLIQYVAKNPQALTTLIGIDPQNDVGNATQGTALRAKDPKTGVELATAVVNTPVGALAQAQNYKDQFPNAEIEVTDTDVVTDERKRMAAQVLDDPRQLGGEFAETPTELKDREALQPVDTTAIDELSRQFGGQRPVVQPIPQKAVRPVPTKQTAQNAQKPQDAPVIEQSDGVDVVSDDFTERIEYRDVPKEADKKEYAIQQLIPRIANRIKADTIDVEKALRELGGDYNAEAGINFKMTPGFLERVDKFRNNRVDVAERTKKSEADFNERVKAIDPTLDAPDRDLEAFRLKGMADIDAGLITPEQQTEAYEKLKKDVDAWKEDRGFLGIWNQKEWADIQRFMGGRPDTGNQRVSESYQPSGVGKEVSSPKEYFDKAYADMQKQYGNATNWVRIQKEHKARFKDAPFLATMKGGEAVVGGAMKAPFQGAASALKSIAIGSEAIDKAIGGDQREAKDRYSYKLAESINDIAEGIKVDEYYKGGNAELFGQIAGQVLTQTGLGLATGGALAPALFGAGQGMATGYEEGTAEGLDGWTRLGKSLVAGLIEAPDYFVFKGMFKGGNVLNKITAVQNLKATLEKGLIARGIVAPVAEKMAVAAADGFATELAAKGGLKGIIGKGLKASANTLKTGGLEAIQEGTTRPLNDLWAFISYDRSPERWEKATTLTGRDFVEGVGGFFGGIIGASAANMIARTQGLDVEGVEQAQALLEQQKELFPEQTYNDAKTALENRKAYFAKDTQIQQETPQTVVTPKVEKTIEPKAEPTAETERKVAPERKSVFDEVFGEEVVEKPKKKIKPTVTTEVTEAPVEQPVEKVVEKSTPKAELIAERDEKIAEIEADAKELEATGKVIEAKNLRQTITPLRMEYKKKLTAKPDVIEKGQNVNIKQPSVDSVNISDLPDGTKVTYTKADGTVVNGTMATDKFGRVVSIGDATRSVKLPWKPVDEPMMMVAWHGSPHKFDKFDSSKIGTGEGAQAYGHGLYFTDQESVAQYYKDALTQPTVDGKTLDSWLYRNDAGDFDNRVFDDVRKEMQRGDTLEDAVEEVVSQLESRLESETYDEDTGAYDSPSAFDALRQIKLLKKFAKASVVFPQGAKYKVQLTPENNEYLLWDKPLNEQASEAVTRLRDGLEQEVADESEMSDIAEAILDNEDLEGKVVYGELVKYFGNQSNASDYLKSLGIRGIKYLDGSSRSIQDLPRRTPKGEWEVGWHSNKRKVFKDYDEAVKYAQEVERNYNYVIFDDADVEIEEMFKRPVEGSPEFAKATELANLPKRGEKFLEGVKTTAKEGFIDLSPEAVEMGRVIDKAVGRSEGIRYGTTYTKAEAIDHIEGAKDLRQVLKDKGMSTKAIDKYIADFEKVAKENQGIVPVGIEASRKHETLHGADLKSRIVNGETITTTKESKAVVKNPTFKKFHDKLNEIVGKTLSTESAMAEAVAYLGDGDYKQFGLTIKEAASVLADIGIARFNSLVEAYDGDVEKAIENMSHFNIEGGEKIYEAIKSTDNGKGVRPSTESGQKREGKSETVGSNDVGDAETAGQGKATTKESDGVGFKPSGEVKQSKTPATLRGNLDLPVKDIDYTSTSNPERKALADSILSEGVDKAKAWVEDQINRKQNNAGATATVGIGVINELGGQGRIDEMNALSEKLLPTITDAAQTVQAVSTASMWNPESAAAYAEMAKMRKFGKGLTAKETAEALELAKAMHNNLVQAATNNTQLAELEARMARLIDENVEYKEMLEVAEGRAELAESDLKAANKQIKALEKEKGDTTVRVPKNTRKRINEIRKVLPQIEKRLNDKYGKINEAMLMAVGPTVDQDLVDWTLINLSKNLTSKSATEIKTEISQRANGQLSANMVDEIHALAMAEMESERTPLTPAQLEAKSILNAEHRNRLSHYSAARKHRLNTMRINLKDLIAGNKPKDFKQKFVDYIVDAGKKYSPEATYVALARTKLKNGQQLTDPNDVIVRLKELEYPDMTHDEVFKALADSQRILNDAKANRQADNIISKYNEKLTAEQIDYIRQDQANVLITRRNIQKKGLGFYESLLKTPGQIKIETLVNFRRANLLTGLKTHGVNIVGNASYQTFDEVVRPLSKVTDFITSKFTNETTIQNMSAGAIFKSFKSLVKDDGLLVKSGKVTGLQAMKDIWANGGTMEDMQRLQHAESILHRAYDKETKPKRFKTAKAIDYYINKVYRSLGAEDAAFKVYAFTRAMQESAYTQAVTEQKKRGETKKWRQERQKELIENPSQVAIQQADDFAQYMTFQNDNAISTLFQHIKNTHYSVRAGAEIVVPFDRTPTNLIFRTLEIFPITGLVASGYKLGRMKYGKGKKFSLQNMKFVPDADFNSRYSDAIRQDNKTELAKMSQADAAKFIADQLGRQYTRKAQADFARTVGRMAPGNALFALGALLAAGGFLTGAMWGGDDDKAERDESMERMSKGIENRSLYVPHVGRFVLPKSPPFDAMVAGATMYEQTMMGKKDPVLNAMNGATETLTDVIWEQPLLNSTTELMTKIDKHKYGEKLGQIGSGFVPASGFQREVSEVFDPVRRSGSGYTGNKKEDDTIKGTLLQQARGFKNSLLKGVPGVRNVAVDKSPLEQPKREWWLTAARWAPGFGIFKPEAAKPYDKYVNQDWVRIRKKLLEEK